MPGTCIGNLGNLKTSGYGCRLYGEIYGCIFYADDMMLLSRFTNAMQFMLKICDDFAIDYDLKSSTENSVAMRIGARHNVMPICEPLKLAGKELQFVQSLKNLGVSYSLQNTSSVQSQWRNATIRGPPSLV